MLKLDASPGRLSRIFQALAFEERRVLLTLLRDAHARGRGGMTINQLAEGAGTSRFTASRHLTILRDAGLVDARRDGTKRVHRIDIEATDEVEDWILQFVDLSMGRSTHPVSLAAV